MNRRSAPEVLKALQFRIAEHPLRETARLLPTAGFRTHDNACHNLLLLHYTQYCIWKAQNCGQLTDGTYRIMPKAMPDSKEPVALSAAGASTPTLAKFDPKSDKARWNFRKP